MKALKLDGYSSPINGYLRGNLCSRIQAILSSSRRFFQTIRNLINLLKTTFAIVKTSRTNAGSEAINWESSFPPIAIISEREMLQFCNCKSKN